MTGPRLTTADFPAFFEAVDRTVKGPDGPASRPFRWQQRLVEEVGTSGRWPRLLDVPTGLGKTAVVDAAVFLQAIRDDAPRRIVYVVDRRVIVQQAAVRARAIATMLDEPDPSPVVAAAADRLRARGATVGGETPPPLVVAELRGGIRRDESWTMRPDVPAVLTSTVDQVGSRLLFRGYGISRGMRPVHAGLLANDVLFVLDEVHLSAAFEATLRTVKERFRVLGALPDRWQVVSLSATPGSDAGGPDVFRLRPDEFAEETVAARVGASKPVTLRLVPVAATAKAPAVRTAVASACVEAVRAFDGSDARAVGVVVNRVATAVDVARRLGQSGVPSVLLTGRMRPIDRDEVVKRALPEYQSGRQRSVEEPFRVLVATQTVEAGVDLDLDALVTECPSLDALRQRFGRVNRLGRWTGDPLTNVVVSTTAQVTPEADDPVYGTAVAATWALLGGGLDDLGIAQAEVTLTAVGDIADLLAPRPHAPVLTSSQLDRWVQTRGVDADPDVEPWLHGLRTASSEVQVVWRADLDRRYLDDLDGGEADRVALDLRMKAMPPMAAEAVAVPLMAVRAWLAGSTPVDIADVDGGVGLGDIGDGAPRPAVRIPVDGEAEVLADPRRLRTGDVVVVPAAYGGLTFGTWDPTSTVEIVDLAEMAARQTGRAMVRLSPLVGGLPDGFPRPDRDAGDGDDASERVLAWLEDSVLDDPLRREVTAFLVANPESVVVDAIVENEPWFLVSSTARMPVVAPVPGVDDEGDDDPSFLGREVALSVHLEDVATWAEAFATACGLPRDLVGCLRLAGRVHDLGKADPRFQSMLRGGVAVDRFDELLAKSRTGPRQSGQRLLAQARSGYPRGERHELLSVAFLRGHPDLVVGASDPLLVEHLVASHHGFARPFLRPSTGAAVDAYVTVDGAELKVSTDHGLGTVGSGIADGFWDVVGRYGWFGEAWLAAILRLADHRASEWEQRRPSKRGLGR